MYIFDTTKEGSPGVGKTSIIAALAAASNHQLIRINVSEQTDLMDLLGSDLPIEGGKPGEFTWCDGVFLQALKVQQLMVHSNPLRQATGYCWMNSI